MESTTRWPVQDCYEVLGLSPAASQSEIAAAYRTMVRRYHPDAHPDIPEAVERFREVCFAHEILSHEVAKRQYDDARRRSERWSETSSFQEAESGPAPVGRSLGGRSGAPFGAPALGAEESGPTRNGPPRLVLSFVEAVFGTSRQLDLPDGRTVTVRTPPGVSDGQRLKIAGPEAVAEPMGRPFSVLVSVEPHPYYTRKGELLMVTVPVTYPELVLGTDIDVPTLEGVFLPVRLPPGTTNGLRVLLREWGVPNRDGPRGDLLVTFELAVTREPSSRERKALQALAKVADTSPRAEQARSITANAPKLARGVA
jgi:molecular chaperone DnaJ